MKGFTSPLNPAFSAFWRRKGNCIAEARPRCRESLPGRRATRLRAANQVWSWDITYLATTITGLFFRLYLVMDIYSRKIVGWEIHENETAEHAATLIRKACLSEGIGQRELVLHSDNGSPMKGASMLATLQRLGVVPSFSRPSVSNDNPYSESLFGTMKYTPAY
ncbi:MAG TPA: transposase, partial [Chromatiaceae bacterium]|nr:transposase [Chromatiaceae bacterium]